MDTLETPILISTVLALVLGWLLVSEWRKQRARSPEKVARWKALPRRFKFACWFGVTPLCLAGFVTFIAASGWWQSLALVVWGLAFVAHAALEIACVGWYRRNGLLPSYEQPGDPAS